MHQPNSADLGEFSTPKALIKNHPNLELTEQQMNWALRHRKTNGLDSAVKKFGRNLIIHVPTFTEWLLSGGNIK